MSQNPKIGSSSPQENEPGVGLRPTIDIDRPVDPQRTALYAIVHRVDLETGEFVDKLPGDPRGMTKVA